MGYDLQAILAKQQTLEQHASKYQHARIVPLAQGIAIIPLTHELYEELGDPAEFHDYYKLSPAVEEWAQRISACGPVAYIEAEYFGGQGGQSAVVWSAGSRVLGPVVAQDAINQALRFLEVQVNDAHDEFDAVGLGQHRDTDDWLQHPRPTMSAHDGPLRNAANNGERDRVSELLRLGANPNAPNQHGDTSLELAASNGHVEVVRLLLQHGADPSLHGHERMTPLGAAITNRHREVVDLLLRSANHSSSEWLQDGLSWAIISGEPAIVAAVLNAGANPAAHREGGKTAVDAAREWLQHAHEDFKPKFREIITILERHRAETKHGNA